jgi:hypothetical protein
MGSAAHPTVLCSVLFPRKHCNVGRTAAHPFSLLFVSPAAGGEMEGYMENKRNIME